MKLIRKVSVSMSLMACLGMVIPQAAVAEAVQPSQRKTSALDVALHGQGALVGQVVDAQGKARSGVSVVVLKQGKELQRVKSDAKGRFVASGLKGGFYQLATSNGQIPVRVWSKKMAPPSASEGALLVDGAVVRGQCNCGPTAGGAVGRYDGVASFNQSGSQPLSSYQGQVATFNQPSSVGTACQGGTCANGHTVGGHGGGGLLGFGLLGGGGAGFGSGAGVFGMSPLVVGGAVAAAVAIPVAIAADDDDDDAS